MMRIHYKVNDQQLQCQHHYGIDNAAFSDPAMMPERVQALEWRIFQS